MSSSALHPLAEAYGVLPVFHDLSGNAHWTNDETKRALLRAMRVEAETEEQARASLQARTEAVNAQIVPPEYVVTAGLGAWIPITQSCEWVLEDEQGLHLASGKAEHQIELPPQDVGVCRLKVKSGVLEQEALVPVAPERTPSLQTRTGKDRVWGVTAALYGLRSSRNLGLGDYTDLADLARILGQTGASFVGINPIHSWGWSNTEVTSPYSPSHRGFLNTLHIAADGIPGLEGNADAAALIEPLLHQVDRSAGLIDYKAIRARQRPVMESLFKVFQEAGPQSAQASLADFTRLGGNDLRLFAVYETLAAQHGESWRAWPDALQDPEDLPADGISAADLEFHIWLQWVAVEQLARVSGAANMSLGLYLDLAVGARRDGAEAWIGRDCVAQGVSLGAPPDHLSPEGQNWQLTAFAPSLAAAGGYRNLRTVLKQVMQPAGLLRIDHVLGLNRSFWLPDDGSPGAYVQQPFETLMALIAIEAHKAGCVVVGEDLGLVPDGFRENLSARGFYGYSVLQYEKEGDGSFRDPAHLRTQSLACFATHDTPTLHGFCSGRDIDWWRRLDWIDDETEVRIRAERANDVAALVPDHRTPAAAIHERLAGSPVAMAAVQLDDVLGEEEAQNLPGTIDEHSNWSRICPVSLQALGACPALLETAELMRVAGRAHSQP